MKNTTLKMLQQHQGDKCLVCSTLNFHKLYDTASGVVRPATLVSCLPQINSQFQKGQQQCAAEFFQEFCRVLGHTANQYQTENLIAASYDLSFLRSFFFELRSEIMCSTCQNVTSNTTMETILPMHLTKGSNVQRFLKDFSTPVQIESSYFCSRCSRGTDAWKRLFTSQARSSFCIQIARFGNDGKKRRDVVEYTEKLVFPEHGKTAEKGTTITDVAYQLRAVIVHEGDKISTGHATFIACYHLLTLSVATVVVNNM